MTGRPCAQVVAWKASWSDSGYSRPVTPSPLLAYTNVAVHLGADMTRVGDLCVFPGEVQIKVKRFAIGRAGDGLVVTQHLGSVQLNTCRFPPWYNTVLLVKGHDQQATVGMSWSKRGPLVRALRLAGFDVDIKKRFLFNLFLP